MPRYSKYGAADDRVVEDGDRGFVGFNNRLRPDQLQPGLLATSENGRMGLNGEWQVRKGIDQILTPITSTTALKLPFTLNDSSPPTIDDGAVEGIYGSCAFSDPNASASQSIVIAANSTAKVFNLSTLTTTDIAYPAGITITSNVDMIQAFDKVFIFRDGATALEWDGNTANDFTKVASGEYTQPVQIVCASGEFALIENRGIVHQADGVSEGDTITVVGDKTLSGDQSSGLVIGSNFVVAKTYAAGSTTSITAASSSVVTGGEFDGLYKVTVTATGHGKHVGDPITVAGFGDTKIDGKRFVAEVTDANTLIFYVPQNPSTTISGDETLALAAGFEFYLSDYEKTSTHVTDGDSLTSTPVFTKKVSVGLGFTHMPAPPFAIYHQRRLVMPFNYTVNDAADSFTANGKLDEVIASDILDTDTYDQIYASFRFNAGTADFIVGLHSFADDTLIVFNRNSIHLVVNSVVLEQAATKLLTDEVGCVARKSIKQIGNQIIFLSDNGVYGVGFIEGYQLRGTEVPLSEPIDATIKTINKTHQDKAIAVYFDNRYYIAVPTGDSTQNNAIIIYNFLNKQWESVDTVNDTGFHISNMFVAGDGNNAGVYIVNDLGGINKLESRVDGKDNITTEIGGSEKEIQVPGVCKSRQYTFGDLERKKYKAFEIHTESSEDLASNFQINAELENLDTTVDVGSLREFNGGRELAAGEDVSIRGRFGNPRAYGLQLDINNVRGRPKLRAFKVNGTESFRSIERAE